jgi:hypothetical protein
LGEVGGFMSVKGRRWLGDKKSPFGKYSSSYKMEMAVTKFTRFVMDNGSKSKIWLLYWILTGVAKVAKCEIRFTLVEGLMLFGPDEVK